MRKSIILTFLLISVCCVFMCAFTFNPNSTVRSLTNPYITTYECTAAQLGKENLLEKYDYIKVTILDCRELEISYKKVNGKKHVKRCEYTYNEQTKELCANTGFLGFRFKQAVKIENGKFTVCMPMLGKTLLMNFSA